MDGQAVLAEPTRPEVSSEPSQRPVEPVVAPAPVAAVRTVVSVLGGPVGVAIVAAIAAAAAAWFAFHHDLTFLYADARSHLTIARRLEDGPNRGIAQLGTVWLPLQHVLLAPFTMFDSPWHTGLAAIPVDLACLVVEALSVFALVRTLGGSRAAAWPAVLVLVTNSSVLYLHTTALTEPVLYAALLATAATVTRWAHAPKPYSGGEIAVYCGLPAAAAVLARYDGWAFVAAITVVIFVIAWRRWRSTRYAFRIARQFATIPVLAALWWMWFNWVNFGDPLEFQRGRYSAQAQQAVLARQGRLPDQHDLMRSTSTYATSIIRGAGWIVVGLGVLGMVVWAFHNRARGAGLVPWLLVVVPFGFYVMSLYTGQIAVRLDQTADDSVFNLRYGVEMMPAFAVFTGLLFVVAARVVRPAPVRVGLGLAVVVLLGVQTAAWWPNWRAVPVVAEGLAQRRVGAAQYAAGEWLHDHAQHGTILIDDSVNPLLPVVEAPLGRVIAPFSGTPWARALRDPARAEWIFVDNGNPDDAVAHAVRHTSSFGRDFVRRFHRGNAEVFQRRPNR